MPRARFTVRALMVAVAVAAVPLYLYHRSARLWALAVQHARICAAGLMPATTGPASWSARAMHHYRMSIKYDLASRRLWLPVAPDPHEPES